MINLKGIKNIIFDFGGVLADLYPERSLKDFEKLGINDIRNYLTPYAHKPPFSLLETGEIDFKELCIQIRKIFKITAKDEEIYEAWKSFVSEIPPKKMELVYKLSKKYKIYLLSNTNPVHIQIIKEFGKYGYNYKTCFDKLYLSYKIGCCKPEKKIFDYLIEDSKINPEETLLIDDSTANCETAYRLGLKTYTPKPFEDFTTMFDIMTPRKENIATMGFFDGVHKGHQFLIQEVIDMAKKENAESTVVTFWPHPRKVLHTKYCPELLNTRNERLAKLRETGIDNIEIIKFTTEISKMSAKTYMKEILKEKFHITKLIIGFNHRFGNNRKEGFEDYCKYGETLGIKVIQSKALIENNVAISSSIIRKQIKNAEIKKAADYLSYNYSFTGTVIEGKKIGRKIGFPTANIKINSQDKLIPPNGVYIVNVHLENDILLRDKIHLGIMNIGTNPTIKNNENIKSIEVHIINYNENLYNKQITIELLNYLRKEIKFETLEELKIQIEKDKKEALKFNKNI